MAKMEKIEKLEDPLRLLMRKAEMLARKKADGHLTIMRFTTCWKVFLETPNLAVGTKVNADDREVFEGPYAQLMNIPGYDTLEGALRAFLANPVRFYDVSEVADAKLSKQEKKIVAKAVAVYGGSFEG